MEYRAGSRRHAGIITARIRRREVDSEPAAAPSTRLGQLLLKCRAEEGLLAYAVKKRSIVSMLSNKLAEGVADPMPELIRSVADQPATAVGGTVVCIVTG